MELVPIAREFKCFQFFSVRGFRCLPQVFVQQYSKYDKSGP